MATQQEVIKIFMQIMAADKTTSSADTVVNNAIKTASGEKFENIDQLTTKFLEDCRNSTDGRSFLREKCGIIIGNSDVGAITGKDAGGVEKTAESVVPETARYGSLQVPSNTMKSFEKKGITIEFEKKYGEYVKANLNEQKNIFQGAYSWWIESAMDLIEESYGIPFLKESKGWKGKNWDGKLKVLLLDSEDMGSGFASTQTIPYFLTNHFYICLRINLDEFEITDLLNENGREKKKGFSLDRLIAHELTHAIMTANIPVHDSLPDFLREGMCELTVGCDDSRKDTIKSLCDGYRDDSDTVLENILRFNQSHYNNSDVGDSEYSAGYMLLRYFANQVVNKTVQLSSNSIYTGQSNTGELVQIGSQTAFIEKGDIVRTKDNDIDTITIVDKNHVITTPKGETATTVIDPNGMPVLITPSKVEVRYSSDGTLQIYGRENNEIITKGNNVQITVEQGKNVACFKNSHFELTRTSKERKTAPPYSA